MKGKILLIAVLMAILGSVTVFADNNDIIKQGDFALLLVKHTKTPVPAGGWNVESAISVLQDVGIVPFSGVWNSDEDITEGDLAYILRLFGISVYSANPDDKVTWGRANAVFFRYDDFFKNYNLKTRTVYGTTTTHIDTAVGGTDSLAPVSPTIP